MAARTSSASAAARTSAKPWVAYTRVSTDEQAQRGISLDAQRAGCEALARAYGHHLLDVVVDDGYSAGSLKRPGVRRVLELIEQRAIAGVIIWKLDRLFRNTLDCLQQVAAMKTAGVELVSVNERIDTSTAIGEAFLTMQAAFAQLERQQISERVSAAFTHLRTLGRWIGGTVPTGMAVETRADGKRYLILDERIAPVVRECWKRVSDGASLRQVAEYLTEARVPNRAKKPWSTSAVSFLLKVKSYIGPLIDQETYDRTQAALAQRQSPARRHLAAAAARSTAKISTDRIWRLQQLAFCAKCGSALVGVTAKGSKGDLYPYLRCTGRVRRGTTFCPVRDLPAQAWEDVVVLRLVRFLANHDELGVKLAELHARSVAMAGPAREERERLTRERDGSQQQLDAALDASLAGGAVARAYAARIAALQTAVEQLEVRLAALVGQLAAADLSAERMREIGEAFRTKVGTMLEQPWEEQRAALREIVGRVDLGSGRPGKIHLRLRELLGDVPVIPGQVLSPGQEWFACLGGERTRDGDAIALVARELRMARGRVAVELVDETALAEAGAPG